MIFILEWFIFYWAVIFCMSLDNIFWIPTSPEYENFKKLPFAKISDTFLEVEGKKYYAKLHYIFGYRVWSVIKHWRDIVPAIISSLLLTIIF